MIEPVLHEDLDAIAIGEVLAQCIRQRAAADHPIRSWLWRMRGDRGAVDEHALGHQPRHQLARVGVLRSRHALEQAVERLRAITAREQRDEPAGIRDAEPVANVLAGDEPHRSAVTRVSRRDREPRCKARPARHVNARRRSAT
ncbi:MAG: hypothetical protein M3619_22780 [Myxococcota bacterium]|nr:hypothetical protein [Myxococcota bacterium]